MNVTPINATTKVANVYAQEEQKPAQKSMQQAPQAQEKLAAPSAELLMANYGVKRAVQDNDPYGAREYLDNHPVSPFVRGEDRENLISAMEKGSVETSNIEMQLALIADNKLTPQTLSHYWKTGKMCDQMEADIYMIYDCYANGKNIDDVYVPNAATQEEGMKNAKVGDVFQVEGQEMIFVKDDEGSSHQLKMDKETFIKLFPPAQRFASSQYAIGDCYLVSGLNTAMENPKTRVALYDAIEQQGNDIHVKYPNGQADYVARGGKVQSVTNPKMILRGALGMQLLEDAFGLELKVKAEDDFRTIQAQKIEEKHAQYQAETDPSQKAIMKKDWLGMRQRLADFEESMKNPSNKTVVLRDDTYEEIIYKEDRYGMQFAKLKDAPENGRKEFKTEKEFYRGSLGGYQGQLMDLLGIDGVQYDSVRDRAKIVELLNQEPSGKYIICGGTWPDGSRTENPVATDKGVYSFHGYTIEGVRNEEGDLKVRASNPWNTAVDADMSVDEFLQFFQLAAFFEVDSYKGITRQDA